MYNAQTKSFSVSRSEVDFVQQSPEDFDVDMSVFLHPYKGAMEIISTKLDLLDKEFGITGERKPVHSVQRRLKSPQSIYDKARRKGIAFTSQEVGASILDIAGIRVVCSYVDDVYIIAEKLLQQSDVSVVRTRDYIKHPKKNGYRSLHLVLTVNVTSFGETLSVPVEVQLRTIAMDMWASLEHELQYKSTLGASTDYMTLKHCADELMKVDRLMQSVYKRTNGCSESA